MDSTPRMSLGLQELLPLNYVKVSPRGWRCVRKYEVTTEAGNIILTGLRDETYMTCMCYCLLSKVHRTLYYRSVEFSVDFVNRNEEKVMNVFHPSCTDCGNDKIIVTVGNEEELATVISEEPNIYKPTYDVCDSQDQRMLRIKGRFSCFSSPEYEVETASETAVGKIVREWHCFQPNEYHLTFPVDLDVRQKCALIATCVFSDTRSC